MKEPALSLLKLLEVVETLRGPGGCPWDQEQSLENIGRHLLEEACEVVDAIEDGEGKPCAAVCEELGDVLMNILMASVIASESGAFEIGAVVSGILEKLIRRHPHVFEDEKAENAEEVLELWNSIKEEEKRGRGESGEVSRLDSVPRSLPSVLRAEKISQKAAACGLDWQDPFAVIEKLREEIAELEEAVSEAGGPSWGEDPVVEEELGDILFTAVNLCRKFDCSAESALRKSTAKFVRRFQGLEQELGDLGSISTAKMNQAWEQMKGDDL